MIYLLTLILLLAQLISTPSILQDYVKLMLVLCNDNYNNTAAATTTTNNNTSKIHHQTFKMFKTLTQPDSTLRVRTSERQADCPHAVISFKYYFLLLLD